MLSLICTRFSATGALLTFFSVLVGAVRDKRTCWVGRVVDCRVRTVGLVTRSATVPLLVGTSNVCLALTPRFSILVSSSLVQLELNSSVVPPRILHGTAEFQWPDFQLPPPLASGAVLCWRDAVCNYGNDQERGSRRMAQFSVFRLLQSSLSAQSLENAYSEILRNKCCVYGPTVGDLRFCILTILRKRNVSAQDLRLCCLIPWMCILGCFVLNGSSWNKPPMIVVNC